MGGCWRCDDLLTILNNDQQIQFMTSLCKYEFEFGNKCGMIGGGRNQCQFLPP